MIELEAKYDGKETQKVHSAQTGTWLDGMSWRGGRGFRTGGVRRCNERDKVTRIVCAVQRNCHARIIIIIYLVFLSNVHEAKKEKRGKTRKRRK